MGSCLDRIAAFLLSGEVLNASQLMAYLDWFRDEIIQRNQALENG